MEVLTQIFDFTIIMRIIAATLWGLQSGWNAK